MNIRFILRQFSGKARVWRAVPTVLAVALILPSAATSGGCESTGATVALSAGVAAGTVVGATVLTRSEVTAKVEVFVPPKGTEHLFEIPDGPRLRQAMAGTSTGLMQVADALDGADDSLSRTAGQLDDTTAYLKNLVDSGFNDPVPQAYETITSYQTTLRETATLITEFRKEVDRLSQLESRAADSQSDPTVASARARTGSMLLRIREALASPEPIPGAYANVVLVDVKRFSAEFMIKFQIQNKNLMEVIESRLDKELKDWFDGDRLTDPTPRFLAIALSSLALDDSSLNNVQSESAKQLDYKGLNGAVGWTTKIGAPPDDKSAIDLLKSNALVLGVPPPGLEDRLSSIWNLLLSANDDDQAAVVGAAMGLQEDMRSAALSEAYQVAYADMKSYRKLTYAALLVDFNIGPISNEVVQGVLTSQAIDVVTNRDNKGQWRPFAHATSRGVAGNHDVAIYFENLATPILKKAEMDPSKFQVAYGQMFSRAFTTLADVYGVPMGAASDTPSDTNLQAARDGARKLADQAAKDTKAVMDAIETMIKLDEKLKTLDLTDAAKRKELEQAIADTKAKLDE